MQERTVPAPTEVPTGEAPTATGGSRMTHFPCFEGLRGLAACLVVVHHATSVGATLAYRSPTVGFTSVAAVMDVGVAVFFVISGFLIYRPFVRSHLDRTPRVGLGTYLGRRFVRILPAYWLALSVLWALEVIDLGPWSRTWRYYALVHIYDASTVVNGIVQAWSLGTEITFYLLVPVWAAAVRRLAPAGRGALLAELVGVAVLIAAGYCSRAAFSATDRIWDQPDVTMRAVSFTWLPNNIDLFALGMGVAVVSLACERELLPARWSATIGRWPALCWAAAGAIFLWYAWRVGPPRFRVGHTGLAWQRRQLVYGAVGLLLLVPAVFGDQRAGFIRGALRWRPVVWAGLVSYGLYLWHYDLMKELPSWLDMSARATNLGALLAVGFGLGLVCAAVSFYALEGPLGRWRQRPR